MREIKFRFWNNEKKEMFDEVTLIGLHYKNDNDPPVYTCDSGSRVSHYSDGAVMQYTGLKDSEGKEVYEGDIVCNVLVGEYFEIEWDTIGAGFLFHNTNQAKRTHGIDYYEFEDMCGGFGFLVLGNVHEHPRLLKEASQ
jgi:uncharacterized phage protein (TIGR01671 family)